MLETPPAICSILKKKYENIGLQFEASKSTLYSPTPIEDTRTYTEVKTTGEGLIILGISIGREQWVTNQLKIKADEY